MLQLIFKKKVTRSASALETSRGQLALSDLQNGESGILDRLDLPEDIARRLMELGFLPGNTVVPARTAPGGGPRVFQVDGSEVALRQETAERVYLRPNPERESVPVS